MKKFLLILTIFCTAGNIYAQKVEKYERVYLGMKGGLNISDVSDLRGDNRLSGHVGLFLHKRLSRQWCIQPEFLFSGQGQQYTAQGDERTLALNYIQIPLMIQYIPANRVYLEFGPQLGFLVSANAKGDDGYKVEVDENYEKVDGGLGFGIGVRATRKLAFYGRYNIWLSDISKGNSDQRNRVGQFGISYQFN